MKREPVIVASARKHGVTDDDILHAVNNPIRFEPVEEGLTMLVGADRAGNLLEVGVVDGTDGPVIVHAMRARAKYLRE